jgi:nucleoid-associated protein YgaU
MFEPNSRYYNLETATYTTPTGAQIAYKRRRFVPRGEDLPLLTAVTVTEGDRLDNLTARTLGDPEAFWRVADANNAMNPTDLEEPGATLRVPIPTA